jgi:1-deoxy-D-xylulose-5-phosphate reductoisomerase
MKRQAAGQPETPRQVLAADQNARNFVLESVQ